ncbi:MAG: Gfo/Idh/MocA family protein [Halobacteriaceae archaeon]
MLTVGFVGCGGRARQHMETLADRDDARIVGACDIDADTAEAAAADFGATAYTDHHELYDEEPLDAVFVVLPPFAHEDQELAAVDAGLDLFVEKPLALTRETARDIRDAIEDAGAVAAVGYQMRHNAATERALDIVSGRAVRLLEGYYRAGLPGVPWWRVRARSGGQVVEQATHVYDLARLFGGDVAEVSAYGGRRVVEEIDFPDAVTANLRHESGAVANVVSSSKTPEGDGTEEGRGIRILAEGCRLHLHGNTLEGTADGDRVAFEGENDPDEDVVGAFVEASAAGDPGAVGCDYADAYRTFEATLAVTESIDSGAPVEL